MSARCGAGCEAGRRLLDADAGFARQRGERRVRRDNARGMQPRRVAPSVGLRALSTATEAASSQPRTVASLPGGGASETPRSAAARNCANNSERASACVAGADEAFARLARRGCHRAGGPWRWRPAGGFRSNAPPPAAPSGACMLLTWRQASSPRPWSQRGLDAQQALLERLLLREPGLVAARARDPHRRRARRRARRARRAGGIRRCRCRWSRRPVARKGPRRRHGRRCGSSSSARSTFGGPPRRGVDGQPVSTSGQCRRRPKAQMVLPKLS